MRSLDRQDGRILSLTWSYDDQTIISGSSVSIIHCLDVKLGMYYNINAKKKFIYIYLYIFVKIAIKKILILINIIT